MSDDDVLKTSKHHGDLRTRIAAALLGDHCIQGMTQPCDDCREHALRQADAVIRELQLTVLGDGIIVGAILGESHA